MDDPMPVASHAPGDIQDIGATLRTAFVPGPQAFAPTPDPVPTAPVAQNNDRSGSRRILKTVLGLTLISAFGVYPLYTLMQPSSVEAVVNARLITLRAPISGRVDGIRTVNDAGILPHGAELLTIHNDRTDRGRLDELESQKGRLANELVAITTKLRNAQEERVQLDAAVQQFSRGRLAQLQARRAELNDEIAIATLSHEEATHAASRSAALASGGNISDVEAARVAREASLAALQTDTLRHRLASLTQEIEAAHAGIFIGDGSNNDRPSSMQRAESVEAEIDSFAVERDRLAAELARVSAEISQDTARFSLLSNAALSIPIEGRMWERLVSPGEEVSSGQAMVRLVDCSTTVVTANVSESVYNVLSVGTAARFIPADDGEDLNGRVVNLTGMANAAANFAIEPSALRKAPYRVLIGLPGSQNASCSIGRTGRVEFDRSDVAAP
ncbi:HlyD family efflux transporter periplasmic adaptor subunit [Aureimonas sp. AU12]|uniref:HlyD family efflux transporter periplasmic adaptor subunit n=1 Tax=Aureimonas sp. AU12 TaxID=1638161 RepID=UPI001AEC8E36|nr:HlyD family efflux transporter periplasmic adaptor subunit [Aureimonas sp. AU12]